jgi:hypothetical protein
LFSASADSPISIAAAAAGNVDNIRLFNAIELINYVNKLFINRGFSTSTSGIIISNSICSHSLSIAIKYI